VSYRLRDWLILTAALLGCQIPMIHCDSLWVGGRAKRRSCR